MFVISSTQLYHLKYTAMKGQEVNRHFYGGAFKCLGEPVTLKLYYYSFVIYRCVRLLSAPYRLPFVKEPLVQLSLTPKYD